MSSSIVLGIEISSNAVCMGLVQEDGQLLAQLSVKHPSQAHALLGLILQHADSLLAGQRLSRQDLSGIGISAVSHIDYGALAQQLGKAFAIPCQLTHIGNAAALAEIQYGMAAHWQDFVAVALDADLQCGIVTGGKLAMGEHGLAGGLGHTLVATGERRERLVDLVSEGGIKRTAWKMLAEMPDPSSMRAYTYEQFSASHVIQAAQSGDKVAMAVFERLGAWLGLKLSDVIHHFSPEAFVFSSALPDVPELLLQPTRIHTEQHTLAIFRGKAKLFVSQVPAKEASVRCAAAVAWHALAQQQTQSPA
jgi:glucokinase